MTWANAARGQNKQPGVPEFKVKVQNISGRAIRGLKIQAAYYDATEDLHTIPVAWNWQSAIAVGAETTLHWSNSEYHTKDFVGWLVAPLKVLYEDGSTWSAPGTPESMAGCFGEYWRDKKHPRITLLPAEILKPTPSDSKPAQ